MTTVRRIVAFDIGLRNFAFIVADVENKRITNILEWVNTSLSETKSRPTWATIYSRINDVLDAYSEILETCHVCLIEKQMSRLNKLATRISHHVFSYYSIIWPNINVLEYLAYHKTENSTCRLKTKLERKKYCIQQTIEDLATAKDDVNLGFFLAQRKLDDLADTYQMIRAYAC